MPEIVLTPFRMKTTRYQTNMIKQQSKLIFWTVVCVFQFGWCCFWFCIDTGDGLYGFGKAAADGLLGSEGAEYRPLAIEALLRVRRPFGWVPNDEMSVGIVVWHNGIYLSIYCSDYSGFTMFLHHNSLGVLILVRFKKTRRFLHPSRLEVWRAGVFRLRGCSALRAAKGSRNGSCRCHETWLDGGGSQW